MNSIVINEIPIGFLLVLEFTKKNGYLKIVKITFVIFKITVNHIFNPSNMPVV